MIKCSIVGGKVYILLSLITWYAAVLDSYQIVFLRYLLVCILDCTVGRILSLVQSLNSVQSYICLEYEESHSEEIEFIEEIGSIELVRQSVGS